MLWKPSVFKQGDWWVVPGICLCCWLVLTAPAIARRTPRRSTSTTPSPQLDCRLGAIANLGVACVGGYHKKIHVRFSNTNATVPPYLMPEELFQRFWEVLKSSLTLHGSWSDREMFWKHWWNMWKLLILLSKIVIEGEVNQKNERHQYSKDPLLNSYILFWHISSVEVWP